MTETVAEIHHKALKLLHQAAWPREEAALAARLVIDEALGQTHSHLVVPDEVLSAQQRAFLTASVADLLRGRPLAHILGRRNFWDFTLQCDHRALAPRPETELLVETALEKIRAAKWEQPSLADLGTGSGCIAIALSRELPQAQIWATDVSPDALDLARSNMSTLSPSGHIQWRLGQRKQWAKPLEDLTGKLDAILTNPPYIPNFDIENLAPQVRDFEPRIALCGGDDGLDCYREIAAQCTALLAPHGFLLAELGQGQFDAVREIFTNCGWHVAAPLLDFAGIERVLSASISEI